LLACSLLLWGVLRSLNDLLVSLFQAAGRLPFATAMLVHASFFSAYLLVCLPAGVYLRRYGYRRGLTVSAGLMAAGAAA